MNPEPIYASDVRSTLPRSEFSTGTVPANDPLGIPIEEMSFLYQDPQGDVQGPFLGVDIISWFDQGFFSTDLPVRLLDVPEGTPFKALGEVMPHLKFRASSQNPGVHSEKLDFIGGNPHDAPNVSVSNGQKISLHSDRIDLQDHNFSRSRPDAGPDVEGALFYFIVLIYLL